MMPFKKILCLVIILCMILMHLFSCSDNSPKDDSDNTTSASETDSSGETGTVQEELNDDLDEYDFNGADFTLTSWPFSSCRNEFVFEEETGDLIDDAMYKRNRTVEERFNVNIKELRHSDGDGTVKRNILSGDPPFDIANIRCTEAFSFWCEGLLLPMEEVPYLDFSKPYWFKQINDSISINNVNYVALGAFDISTYEQTFALVFNKKLVEDYGLESPYELVRSGKWTMDKMDEMMKQVINNIDSDGKLAKDGIYGYMGHTMHSMPGFWMGAGETILKKDENDSIYLTIENERFITVFNKIFEITWDNNAWYRNTDNQDANVPTENLNKFVADQCLFMDTSFHFIQDFRNMETDFGIIPYPKLDETQGDYVARLSYFYPFIVPVSCVDEQLDKIGIMLEALNSESAKTVIPIYYDVSLKTKYSRDDESNEMIDLIFSVRVCDIADSTFANLIRDGLIQSMFKSNNRNIVSKINSIETIINKQIAKIPN